MATDTQRSVKLRIVADAGTAKETLDDIAAKTDNLEGKDASVRINVNSGTTKEQLDEISAKAEALGIKKVTFSVKASTAVANAEIKETEHNVDSLRDKLAKLAAEESFAEAGAGLLRVGMLGLAPAMIPVAAAAVSISAGLVPALAAGGVGLGVFGVAAKGAFAEVTKANQANQKLTGGLGELQSSLGTAKTDFQSFVSQSADGVAHTLAPALSLVPKILQDMKMFLTPAEAGLRTLAIQVKGAFDSKGATGFAHSLAGLVQPAIVNLGDAFGHVAHGVGGLFKDLIPQAGGVEKLITRIASAFDKWANSASTASGIKSLFAYFQSTGPKLGQVFKELAADVPKIVSALKGFGAGSLSGISVILTVIGKLSPGQLQLISVGILAIKAATTAWKIALIGLDVVSELNPWVLAFTGVAVVILLVATHFKTLKKWAMDVFDWVKSNWPLLTEILLGPIGIAVVQIIKHWTTIKNTFHTVLNDIKLAWPTVKAMLINPIKSAVSWIKGLPGMIWGAIKNIPGLFETIGKNCIIGLYNGMVSLFNWLLGWVENHLFGGVIGKALHVLGMNSPSKVFADMGSGIVEGLVVGMDRNAHQAVGSVANLATAVTKGFNPTLNAGTVAGAGSLSRGNVTNNFNVTVSGVVGDEAATGRKIAQSLNVYLRQTGQPQLVGV